MAKPGQVERKWYVIDATDVPLDAFQQLLLAYFAEKQTNIHTTLIQG